MASIVKDSGGRKRLQFTDPKNGKRRTLRLGKMSIKDASSIRVRIEAIVASHASGLPIDLDTAKWVGQLTGPLADRLRKMGLIEAKHKQHQTLDEWIGDYIASRKDVEESTKWLYKHTRRNLAEYFGTTKLLSSFTEYDAEQWFRWLSTETHLAEATCQKRGQCAKQFFRAAKRAKLIEDNPFAIIKVGSAANPDRQFYVSVEVTEKCIDAAPCAQWRAIIALCRYAGLRCPSEIVTLRWEDILWDQGKIVIHSKKQKKWLFHKMAGGIDR